MAEDQGVEQLLAFATSAIRDAPNGEEVLSRVRTETGVDLQVLPGGDEARLTFLAVRRWFGWSAGRLLVLDIGGGSLELAFGDDELPDAAVSLPLGAGRLTRDRLPGDPPAAEEVKAARKYVRAEVARVVRDLTRHGEPDLVVGTSKTFRSLARICGAAPSGEGPFVSAGPAPRRLGRAGAAPGRDDRRPAVRAARSVHHREPRNCWPVRWSPTPPWTCSELRRSPCARGPCGRGSSCAASTRWQVKDDGRTPDGRR